MFHYHISNLFYRILGFIYNISFHLIKSHCMLLFTNPYYPKKVSHSFSLCSHFPLALAALLLPQRLGLQRLNPLSSRFTAFTLTSLSRTLHAQRRYVSAATCHLLGLCMCCLVVLNCDSSSSFCLCHLSLSTST